MSEAEDYRANLEVCRRMAEKAPNELEKRAWLDMANLGRFCLLPVSNRQLTKILIHRLQATAQYASPPCAFGPCGKPEDTFWNIERSARRQRALLDLCIGPNGSPARADLASRAAT